MSKALTLLLTLPTADFHHALCTSETESLTYLASLISVLFCFVLFFLP